MWGTPSRGCLGLLAVVALLLVIAVLWDLLHGWKPGNINPGSPPAGVQQGTQLPWRVLDSAPMSYLSGLVLGESGVLGGLIAGNFDADPDDELMLINRRRGRIYDVDGSLRNVGIHGDAYLVQARGWDYDGDGIDEVVADPLMYSIVHNRKKPSQAGLPSTTPIIDLSGNLVASLTGRPNTAEEALVGDYDGDGRDELWLFEGGKVLVYGTGGAQVGQLSLAGRVLHSALGDVDGDGLAELVAMAGKPFEIVAIGKDQRRAVLGSWSELGGTTNCVDVDGDGRAELLNGTSGYYTSDGGYVPLLAPAGAARDSMPLTTPVAGDFDGDGNVQIAVVSDGVPFGTGILLYSSSGACEYYEEFGDTVWSTAMLHSGGKEYLVVQLTTQILIYP